MYVFNENGKGYAVCSQNAAYKVINSVNLMQNELVNAENMPFFKVKGVDNCVMFLYAEMSKIDKVKFAENLFDEGVEITIEYVINKIVPKLNTLLKTINEKKEEDISYYCVILQRDNIFLIMDGMVEMVDQYAIGPWGGALIGSKDIMKDIPVYERLSKVCSMCEKTLGDCIFPICVMDTESEKMKVIERGDYNESDCSL